MSGCTGSGSAGTEAASGPIASPDPADYGLLALIALCLIVAGVLLIKVEAWARSYHDRSTNRDRPTTKGEE